MSALLHYFKKSWNFIGKHFFQYFIGKAILKSLSFITIPLLTSYLSTEELGLYYLMISGSGLATIVFTLGIRQHFSIQFFKFRTTYRRLELLHSILKLYGSVSLLLFSILSAIIMFTVGSSFKIPCLFFSLYFSIDIFNEIYLGFLNYNQRFLKYNILSVIFGMTHLLLMGLFVVILDLNLVGLSLSFFLISLVQLSYSLLSSRKEIKIIKRISKKKNKLPIKPLMQASIPFIPSSISFWLLMNTDQWMIGNMMGLSSVAIYALATKFAVLFDKLVSESFIAVYTPKIFNLFRTDPQKAKKANSYISFAILLSGGIFFFVISKMSFVVRHVIHENFYSAIPFIAPLTIAAIIRFAMNILNLDLKFANKIGFIIKLNIFGGICNGCLNFFLIPIYELWGCLIATLSSFAIMYIITLVKTLSLKPPKEGKKMLLSAITMVKNEEEFIGYTLMSMYDYLDEIIVVDGGSDDGTVDIINHIREKYDPDNKIVYWQDLRPKNELIHTRNDMVTACNGKWILRLEGDEVYSRANGERVRSFIEQGKIKSDVLSVGWPYYFFVNDITTIVPVGEDHTFATIMIQNLPGIHAAHHDRGGNETFYDEGWFDKDGKEISIWHPRDNPTQRVKGIGIHHYAGFKASTRHKDYMLSCKKVPFKDGHPEVFQEYDFKPLMIKEESREVIEQIESQVGVVQKKTVIEKIRKRFKGY